MRFFTLSLAVATLSAGTLSIEQPDPRPLVLVVHGRGLLGQDSAMLRRQWKRDLDASLAAVSFPRLADDDVRVAWYADVLDAESDNGCGQSTGDRTESLGLGTFVSGFFASLTSELPEEESRGARGLIGDLLYLLDPWKRCAAERRVGQIIEQSSRERPVIVMAYSLGSVVTYRHLTTGSPKMSNDVHLITVGSPLGIREIRDFLLDQEPKSLSLPIGVRRWVNIYDPDDPFAARIGENKDTAGVRDRATQSEALGNVHGVERYLRDRATGVALARSLCLMAKAQFSEPCRVLSAD